MGIKYCKMKLGLDRALPLSLYLFQLKFEDDLQITQMFSAEGENVPLCEELYPIGNIEDWMLEIERVSRQTIRSVLAAALPDYTQVRAVREQDMHSS